MIWTTRQRSKFGQLAGIKAGDGSSVILIHGVGLRAEAWGPQIDMLAQDHRVIAVDLPGHGESAPLSDNPQLADFTDMIAAPLTEPTVVIGHSFGAMIALDMAHRYPHIVRGVAALNAIFQRDGAAKAAVMARAASLDGVTTGDPTATLTRWFGAAPSASRDACRNWLNEVDPIGYRDAYRVFAAQDGPAECALQNLYCPALFLTGADEPNSTPEMSERMAKLAPHGRAKIVTGAAHMLPMTHVPDVNQHLAQFIQEHAR